MQQIIQWLEQMSVTHYGGNSVQDYLVTLMLLVLGVFVARGARFVLSRLLPRLAQLTASDLDDRIVERTLGPLAATTLLPFVTIGIGLLEMPVTIRRLLNNGVTVAMNVLFAVMVLRVVDIVFRHGLPRWRGQSKQGVTSQALEFGRKFTKISVVVVFAVGILKTFGFDIFSLVTGLGIGGLAVALAAQETLGNVLGSLQIMTDRPYDVGDIIRVGGHMGRVTTVGLRSTKLLSPTGVQIVIPNKRLAESPIENLSVFRGLTVELTVGLTYDASAADLQEMIDVLKNDISAHDDVDDEVEVYFRGFGASSLDLHIVYFIPDVSKRLKVRSEMNLLIRQRVERQGLAFAFPTQTLHFAHESQAKSP
ncbi:MAG: hypothetical protein CMH53_10365 [Myxococcales bacterium]|nr:hypothetical protein [Myxococcales bacterium]